jgi:hypothetical protein
VCAYRIVQESLSNASQHAPGAPVTVSVHRDSGAVLLRVANGPGGSAGPCENGPRPGHGLTGMRERVALLDGLTRDTDIFDLADELAPLHPRNDTFPGEVLLHLAAGALDWCGASRTGPLPLEGSGAASCPSARTPATPFALSPNWASLQHIGWLRPFR